MVVFNSNFVFNTKGEFDIINLTHQVNNAVKESGINEGIALVFAGHATGVIILNEYDVALLEDLKDLMKMMTPYDGDYHHYGNAFSHLRSMLFSPNQVVPVHNGKLGLGTWQTLYWVEAEKRPRHRRVEITVIGE
jgi:secondary thiamine-phosphate synthase enzyme